METLHLQLIETAATLLIALLIRKVSGSSIQRAARRFVFQENRVTVMLKLLNFGLSVTVLIVILLIWGVSQQQLLLYISSMLTVLGVALFAQWSLLSNVTASVLLFLNHPAKIGDRIQILDKEFQIEGKITDISGFFISIETDEREVITIPNSLLFQKSVKVTCQITNKQIG
jgi:small-conductance mechanosensitive channel